MTRVAEFFAMDTDELENRLVESRRELLNLRFQLATGQLDNVAQIKGVRRDVARILTVLREMEIAETEGVEFEAPALQPARVRAQRRDREVAEALENEEIEIETADEEAEPPPARLRRSHKVEATDEEASEVVEVEAAPSKTRVRRTRKAASTAEAAPAEVADAPEPAARTKGRRSRKAEEFADQPSADEEQ